MGILCSIKNLSLAFGQKPIFSQAEMTINQGDHIGLIGLNGQGKSTLFRILTKEIKPDESKPAFIFDRNTDSCNIFLVPQELDTDSYSDLTIQNFFLSFYPHLYKTHLRLEEIDKLLQSGDNFEKLISEQEKLLQDFEKNFGWEIQNNYNSYLKSFGLAERTDAISTLSGGEKRKLALSVGLSAKADLILWDEPTNHLDIETIERFEDELMNAEGTFIVITHDRYLLNNITNRIFHIERGKINSFSGNYFDYLEYLEAKELELQKNLDKLQNRHRRELAWMRQGVKARGTRSKKRVETFHNINEKIDDIKSRSKKIVDLNLLHSGRKSKLLVQIEDGAFSYNERLLFKNLNLVIAKKDKIALMGANGAGKTTLINILIEKLKLTSGKQKNAQNLKVISFDQNRQQLDDRKSPLEIVGEGLSHVTLGNGEQKHIHSYLEGFLFNSDQINRPINTLSGGEKNRLQLAYFMKQAADLWIFDEPTNDLDVETIELLERELKSYESAVLIISHDRAFLDSICTSAWIINKQTIEVFEGGYTQVAPYLQALEMEKEVEQENKKLQQSKKSKGMSFAEKKRWETIEVEIENTENSLNEINDKLANFDFTSNSVNKNKDYDNLNKKKSELEKSVENLYKEWEILSAKNKD